MRMPVTVFMRFSAVNIADIVTNRPIFGNAFVANRPTSTIRRPGNSKRLIAHAAGRQTTRGDEDRDRREDERVLHGDGQAAVLEHGAPPLQRPAVGQRGSGRSSSWRRPGRPATAAARG